MKRKRQQMILQLIESNILLTQEDLQNALLKAGFEVTQSTVSRDMKELNLVKGTDSKGNYRYLSGIAAGKQTHSDNQYEEMITAATKSVDFALNNVVVKCFGGMASSACVAIDALYGSMMLGSLAGDDTIIIVTKTAAAAEDLANSLNKLL